MVLSTWMTPSHQLHVTYPKIPLPQQQKETAVHGPPIKL